MSEGYNGWSNYETWAVKLWLDNDEGSYRYWQEQTRDAWSATDEDESREDRLQDAIPNLARSLKSEHEDALPEVEGFAADLLRAAFGEVDWYEIAGSLLEDVADEVEA